MTDNASEPSIAPLEDEICRRCLSVDVLRRAPTVEQKLAHMEDHITMECRLKTDHSQAPTRADIMRTCFPAFGQSQLSSFIEDDLGMNAEAQLNTIQLRIREPQVQPRHELKLRKTNFPKTEPNEPNYYTADTDKNPDKHSTVPAPNEANITENNVSRQRLEPTEITLNERPGPCHSSTPKPTSPRPTATAISFSGQHLQTFSVTALLSRPSFERVVLNSPRRIPSIRLREKDTTNNNFAHIEEAPSKRLPLKLVQLIQLPLKMPGQNALDCGELLSRDAPNERLPSKRGPLGRLSLMPRSEDELECSAGLNGNASSGQQPLTLTSDDCLGSQSKRQTDVNSRRTSLASPASVWPLTYDRSELIKRRPSSKTARKALPMRVSRQLSDESGRKPESTTSVDIEPYILNPADVPAQVNSITSVRSASKLPSVTKVRQTHLHSNVDSRHANTKTLRLLNQRFTMGNSHVKEDTESELKTHSTVQRSTDLVRRSNEGVGRLTDAQINIANWRRRFERPTERNIVIAEESINALITNVASTHQTTPTVEHLLGKGRLNIIRDKTQRCRPERICDDCGKIVDVESIAVHVKTHMRREIICPKCSYSSMDEKKFKRHFREIHVNQLRFSCHLCIKVCNRPGRLQAHINRIHLRLPPKQPDGVFICDHCGRSFGKLWYLTRHQANHRDEWPYQCGECDRRFKFTTTATMHQITHSSARNFACDDCEGRFKDKDTLKTHMTRHTGERAFQCAVCRRVFRARVSLRNHKRRWRHFD